MNIDRLIESHGGEVARVSRRSVEKRIAAGIVVGVSASTLLVAVTIGVRPDLAVAVRSFAFWVKTSYTLSLAGIAMLAVAKLARPGQVVRRSLFLLAVPALFLAGVGLSELAQSPRDEWLSIWLGRSWRICPLLVLVLSAPIFAGLLWSFRRLAPTNLRAAGTTAGLCAGAWAATVYCLHCPETSAIFVLTWYTLGILFAAGFGALMGPRLLRW